MDFVIGAALLAAGIVLNRVFETFWPSKEAARQRQATKDREEREARRRHRSELVKPLIELLDVIGTTSEKASSAELALEQSEAIAKAFADIGASAKEVERLFEEDLKQIRGAHAHYILEQGIPLLSRISDALTQRAVREVLMLSTHPGLLPTQLISNKVAEAHQRLEDWVSSVE